MKVIRVSNIIYLVFLFLSFFLLAYFSLGKSFKFSLFGDDWLQLYVIDRTYGLGNPFPYITLKGYTHPWGIMNICLMIVKYFFGYASYGYFLASLMVRVVAALIGYIFFSKFCKSKLLGLVGSLFVLVGFSGLESTSSVLFINVYLLLVFLFLSLIFLIDSYKGRYRHLNLALSCLFFGLSLAAAPIRTHGLLPFIITFELVNGIIIERLKLKLLLFRLLCFFAVTLFVFKLGFFGSYGLGGDWSFINLPVILEMIKHRDFTFLSGFVTNLGKAFLPDAYIINLSSVIRMVGNRWFRWILAIGFLVQSILFWLLSSSTKKRIKNYLIVVVISILSFLFMVLILRVFPRNESFLQVLINSILGVFFLNFSIWAIYLMFIAKERNAIEGWVGILIGPILIFSSLAVPLLFNPGAVFGSSHRYLTLSLVGVALAIVSLLKITAKTSNKIAFFILVLFLLIFNINSDRKYFSDLYPFRNLEITNSVWNQIFNLVPKDTYPYKFLLFYFDDRENAVLAHDTILFGFNPRMALEYNIKDQSKIPAYVNSYDELVSALTDGKVLLRLGYPGKKIRVDQIYAFRISKSGTLINITERTRRDLNVKIKKYEK